jgi:hypothetical protein
MKTPLPFRGRWRLVEMVMWDQEFLDLVVEAHVTIDTTRSATSSSGWSQARWIVASTPMPASREPPSLG